MAQKQQAKLVNIPRYVRDPFYRYKMPVLQTHTEGRGNGKKTLIDNMVRVALALNRPPEYCCKFFGFHVGALTTCNVKEKKYIMNGWHDAESLAKSLDVFIDTFILCGTCQNPETQLRIEGGKHNALINLACKACGKLTPCDMRGRMATYIVKHPPVGSKRDQHYKKTKKEKEDPDIVFDKKVDETEEHVFSLDTSKDAVDQRRAALLGVTSTSTTTSVLESETMTRDEVFKLISHLVRTENDHKALRKQIRTLSKTMHWHAFVTFKAVFGALFTASIATTLETRLPILLLFMDTANVKHQWRLLFCLEMLCTRYKTIKMPMAHILHYLYDQEVLDEEVVQKWHRHHSRKIDADVGKQIRMDVKPFITWLGDADTESSSSDEDAMLMRNASFFNL